MTPIHFGTKRGFWLIRALGAVGMAAVCTIPLRAGLGSIAGWAGLIGVVFFGIGAVVGLVQGVRRGPRLTLDANGVHDRTLGAGVIAWSDIAEAAPYGVAGKPFIALHLRDPAKYLARTSRMKRQFARLNAASGLSPFSVNLVGLDADPSEVAELIMSKVYAGRAAG
jgi:hypothetical protein